MLTVPCCGHRRNEERVEVIKMASWAGLVAIALTFFGAGVAAGIVVEKVLELRRGSKREPAGAAEDRFERWATRNASVIDKWFAAYRPAVASAYDEMLTRLLTRNDLPRC